MSKKSRYLNLSLPSDFPTELYDEVANGIVRANTMGSENLMEFIGAWRAVAYSFISCSEYSVEFIQLMEFSGSNPSYEDQYLQEKHLFNFFIVGLSVVESLCYALFAIGAHCDLRAFPFDTPTKKRKVTPESTENNYATKFASENVSALLTGLINSPEYKDWKDIRNLLIHRISPGRLVSLSTIGKITPDIWSNGIVLDKNTTPIRRGWLANQLTLLIFSTNEFTKNNLAHV